MKIESFEKEDNSRAQNQTNIFQKRFGVKVSGRNRAERMFRVVAVAMREQGLARAPAESKHFEATMDFESNLTLAMKV
jgi:hypothetical protein